MKKYYYYWVLMFSIVISISSCSKNEVVNGALCDLTVRVLLKNQVSDFSTFQVTIVEQKSGKEFKTKADNEGYAKFDLPFGTYDLQAENLINGVSTLYGHKKNVTLSENKTLIEIEVSSIINSMEKSFVLDELYFNGDKNGEWNSIYYESYLTIRNVSDRPLFADGLSIAICGDYNSIESSEDNPMPGYLKKDTVIITQLYTIPGEGNQYKVEPGESLVLAHSAINHKLGEDGQIDETKIRSIDLSGADFEFFVPYEYTMTVDNPEVTNMIVDYSMNQAFNWGYSGSTPIMLARLDEAKKQEMLDNKINLPLPHSMGTMKMEHLALPVSCIIDGVETGSINNLFHKVLPDKVDRGSILINSGGLYGGFEGQFIKRREITDAQGNTTVKDTNNSTDDFEIIEHGQKSYPKK
ncbi:MAG: DUF4876 domain-containing protein [Candidatus Phocaeicola faecipullorum]|nr:DUF4876 domain-containing protein [Candidatus Phocaeicola faecipullorum]